MEITFELRRKPKKRGAVLSYSDLTLVCADRGPLLTTTTHQGTLTKPIEICNMSGAPQLLFGPNRGGFAPSKHMVMTLQKDTFVQFKHSAVMLPFGGKAFLVEDANGQEILQLARSETLSKESLNSVGAWLNDDLVLMRDGNVLGYTGIKPDATQQDVTVTSVAKGLVGGFAEVSGLIARELTDSFREDVLGHEIEREDFLADQLTLCGEGTDLDPQVVFAILLFKRCYHEHRNR